jgi:hypothetical protein
VEHRLGGEAVVDQRLQGLRFDMSGENVALGGDTVTVHDALMHSPHHRDNILDPEFNAVGIGVVRTGRGIYVTQDFAHRLPELTVEEVEALAASTLNRMRRAAGVAELAWLAAPELRRQACQMASTNRLNAHAALGRRVQHSVAFTLLDTADMAGSLASLRNGAGSGFAVGACYQSSATYTHPVFWIVAVTYY